MARTRRRWLRRLFFFGAIAAVLGARQKKMEENDRRSGVAWDPADS